MDTSKKIIRGVVNSRGFTITSPITQWDYGWQFIPEIDDLPPTYRLDFSNEEKHGTALPVYCSTDGAEVPTELIDTGKDVWVWFVRIGDGFGITEYKWRVPNKCKPKTEQDEPTPTQQSSIDQAIARSNEAVEQAEQSASEADQSSQSASADADRAEQAKEDASTFAQRSANSAQASADYSASAQASATASAQSASQSAQIKDDVEGMMDDAQASASASAQSASQALTYKTDAESAKTSAQTAQGLAESARDSAVQAKTDAESARDEAETARDEAQQAVASISGALADKAPVIIDTASGAIASFSDGADDLPLKSLVVDINPIQDLHGYDSPWVAGGGVNKLPPMVDGTYTGNGLTAVVKNGVATLSGTSTASGNALIIPLAEEYTVADGYLHLCNSVANASFAPTLEDVNDISASGIAWACSPVNRVVAIPSDKIGRKWNRVRVWIGSGVTISGTYSPMVCADNTVRSYAPYENICPISGWTEVNVNHSDADMTNPTTITIDLGQTVYGGKLDVLTGKLTVYPYYASYNGETLTGEWISDRDVYAVGTTPTIGAQVVNIGAEGTEIQLEPHEVASLLGQNNIFADTGDTSTEYRADTTLYIQRLTEPDSADMIADANIVSGSYFMVGNSLYKATANIANGAQIVVGTNCTRVSLAQALNEINS